jgi:ATP-dependent Clp protease ATP-binding subunit ClpC
MDGKNIYFEDKRFFFSEAENFLYKLVSFSFISLFLTGTIVLVLFSGGRGKYLGILLLLFLLNKIYRLNKGRKTIYDLKKKGGNLREVFTNQSLNVLLNSFYAARGGGKNFYLSVLENLCVLKEIKIILERLDVKTEDFLKKADFYLSQKSQGEIKEDLEKVILSSYENAVLTNDNYLYPRNIFGGLAEIDDKDLKKVFAVFDLKTEDIGSAVIFGKWKNLSKLTVPQKIGEFVKVHNFKERRVMNRAWTARPTPTLDQYSMDLTESARKNKLGFLIGHEKEFNQLVEAISRPGKPNALLVGEPGTGKSTIVDHLAYAIIKDEVPEVIFDKRLVSLNLSGLLAGKEDEVSSRIIQITDEIIRSGNIILFIPLIHDLFKNSTQGLSAIDTLLPIIRNAYIPVIGETFPKEYKKYIEPNSSFIDQFEVIRVQELDENESVQFLIYNSVIFENKYKVFTPFKTIRKIVYLAKRYMREKPLPGSALNLFEEAIGRAVKEKRSKISEEDIEEIVEKTTGLPIRKISSAEADKVLNLEEYIHKKFINQDDAVSAVSKAIREYRSGLSRKGGPIASFLFVGPTGVGKTELSKILAEVNFGSKENMIRLDMSEYQEKTSIYRLLGYPDGSYGGMLTDSVSSNPYSLILLDEFEKAHPDILNVFLQVFDDGRLTDNLGKTVDFQNTIIIATSNANSEFIKQQIEAGKKISEISLEMKKKLSAYFKPELLNRFSDIVVFRELNKEEIKQIANLLIQDLKKTLMEEKGIDIVLEEGVLERLVEIGYDPVFGARPLRKAISENIKDILAQGILSGSIKKGDVVKIFRKDDKFDFTKTEGLA